MSVFFSSEISSDPESAPAFRWFAEVVLDNRAAPFPTMTALLASSLIGVIALLLITGRVDLGKWGEWLTALSR